MSNTMHALTKKYAKVGLWEDCVEIPKVGINDVKIKIKKTAICGTDIHIYDWNEWAQNTIPLGMTIGHEFMGEVVEVGSNADGFKIGDTVSGEGHIVCGKCRNCLAGRRHLCKLTSGVGVNQNGAFAEYLVIPYTNVWHCSDKISDDIYAIFDPYGNAVHTALEFDIVGEDVLITGAGPIGIMAAAVAKHAGARHIVITDINDYRLELAQKLGIKNTVNIGKKKITDVMNELNMKEGFDVGLEMSGNPIAFKGMVDVMYHGGKIALLGIPEKNEAIDWNKVIFNGLSIKGIYGREMYETWYKMTSMIESGLDLSPLITHRYDIRDFEKGFAAMKSGNSGKVILDWTNL